MANKQQKDYTPYATDIGLTDVFTRQLAAGGAGSTKGVQPPLIRGTRGVLNVLDRDYGVVGDGSADDTAAVQALLDAGAGKTLYFPKATYRCANMLFRVANCTLLAEPGATFLNNAQSPDNVLFSLGTPPLDTVALTTSTPGGRAIVVADGSTFAAGHRILISAGTFTGSGTEEGPIQFATVASVAGTTLTLVEYVRENFASLGISGQSGPSVRRFGATPNINNRISGFTFQMAGVQNGLTFGIVHAENIEIDHCVWNGCGQGLMTGHRMSGINFHHNYGYGTAADGGVCLNPATMIDSRIVSNRLNFVQASDPQLGNSIAAEVFCDRNLIFDNKINPHTRTSSGGIEFSFNDRWNRIIGNEILGIPGGTTALGIRVNVNGTSGYTGGCVITDNIIPDTSAANACPAGNASANSFIDNNVLGSTL